jgi:hypothetical protein
LPVVAQVEPFFLTPDDLDVTAMLSIMQLQGGEVRRHRREIAGNCERLIA